MSDRKYKIFALITMVALCSHGAANEPITPPDRCASLSEKSGSNRLETLTMALELASHAGADRSRQLRKIRKQLRDSSDTGEKLIDSYAFLLQVASLIETREYEQARAQLRRVSISHPKAVTAGLLMAESYRLEGQLDTARDWFLRVANAFPHHPETQQGLLSAALDAERAGQNRLARALLHKSGTMAEASAELAGSLVLGTDREKVNLVFSSPEGLPGEIYATFQGVLLDEQPEMATLLQTIKQTRQRHACIKHRWQAAQAQEQTLSTMQAQYREHRANALIQIDQRERKLSLMKQAIKPGDLGNEQIALRQRIRSEENMLKREKLALATIEQNLATAESMVASATHELDEIKTAFRTQWRQEMNSVVNAIETSAEKTIGIYRDIAGSAYQGLGEIESR